MLALAAAMSLGFASCSDNNENNEGQGSDKDTQFAAIAQQYLTNTVNVTYKNLADQTELLVEQLEALRADKTDANVQTVCNTFLEARAWWEKSEAFLYGAASDFGIDPHIDSWPLDLDGLLVALKNDAQIEAMDSDEGDVYAGNKLGAELLGFHGIEYIIFKDGAAKPAAEIADKELIYAIAVAGDLRNKCYQLQVSWMGADNCASSRVAKLDDLEWNYTVSGTSFSYDENMLNAGKAGSTFVTWTAAMQQIIDGCMDISDEVGTSKIGKPHTGEDKNYIESPYSENSIQDFYDNIISIQNAYMGGIDTQRNESLSIHNYIKSVNASLDTECVAAINNALAKIKAMKAPFVKNYSDESAQTAMDACDELNKTLQKVKEQLAK